MQKRISKFTEIATSTLYQYIPKSLRFTFDAMEVADRFARLKDRDGVSFMALYPSPPLAAVQNIDLYTGHCRELADRYRRGQDLRPGTWAELAAATMQVSLEAPLSEIGAAVYARALREALGSRLPDELQDAVQALDREPWPGAVDEEVERLRRRLAVSDRR